MAGIRGKPLKSGKYQGWFMDRTGKQRFFSGTRRKTETLRMAQRIEDEHRQVALGYRPAPTDADRYAARPIGEALSEYQEWGNAQGGRGGRPWSHWHSHTRRVQLEFWTEALHLDALGDLDGVLPKAESALRELKAGGRARKTVQSYAECLRAFCLWCVRRHYLARDPLADLAHMDTTPETERRALTRDEVLRLLAACAPERRLVYQVALATGLRARELRSLRVRDLDVDGCGLHLRAEWTKARKDGWQPMSPDLLRELAREAEGKPQGAALLHVPSHQAREIAKDYKAAGIAKETAQGKVDFHTLRVTFVSGIVEAGASVKEAQTLARHSTPQLTMNTYAKVRPARLAELAAKVDGQAREYVPTMHALAAGAEGQVISAGPSAGYARASVVEDTGLESESRGGKKSAPEPQKPCKLRVFAHPQSSGAAVPGHPPGSFPHETYGHSMYAPGLALVVDAWPMLADSERGAILQIVKGRRP